MVISKAKIKDINPRASGSIGIHDYLSVVHNQHRGKCMLWHAIQNKKGRGERIKRVIIRVKKAVRK